MIANMSRSSGTRYMNDDGLPPDTLGNVRAAQHVSQATADRRYRDIKFQDTVNDHIRRLAGLNSWKSVQVPGKDPFAREESIRYAVAVNSTLDLDIGGSAFGFVDGRSLPKRTESSEAYRHDPWVVRSILDATIHMCGTPNDDKHSRDTACKPAHLYLKSPLEETDDSWALLEHVHNELGFGGSQRRTRGHLDDAGTWSGDTWTGFKSYAARVLNGAHALVSNSSSLLTMACLLGSIPHVAGAPHSQDSRGKAMLDTAHDIESFMIGLGSILVTVAPVVIWLATAARLWYILRWHTRELAHPVYSGALAIMAGVAYGAVRRAVGESASKEETILAVFVACWTSFVADSRRKVNNKQQYFLRVVFGGGIACLLVTAVQFIDQEPHKVAQQTATAPLNQSTGVGQTFEPGALGSQEATTFLTMAKTNAPFLLIITSVAIYIWQMYIEVGPRSTPTTHAAP